MKHLFDQLSLRTCRMTTHTYSTSFSLGIRFLDQPVRDHIHAIYGFVRLADEIVDSFHGYRRSTLLASFQRDTFEAIEAGISFHPVLNAFQHTVNKFQIDHAHIRNFFSSMETDLWRGEHDQRSYKDYIDGSAEVVGLVCLQVFTGGDRESYHRLEGPARSLGAAFQKVNFLRDIHDDSARLKRSYFPGVPSGTLTTESKHLIEADIEKDFQHALSGIKQLPVSSRMGVFLAYVYYRSLFSKIKRLPPQRIMKQRVRLHNGRKVGIMLNTIMQYKLNLF